MSDDLYTAEERAAFILGKHHLAYASRREIEGEMQVDEARNSLELAERYMAFLMLILDPEADDESKGIAMEMIYLKGYLDATAGVALP